MTVERAEQKLNILENEDLFKNLINKANSRSILFTVREPFENFPNFQLDDNRLRLLAIEYLSIGCTFAENQQIEKAIYPLRKGAQLISYIDYPEANQSTGGVFSYYLLCSSLAFYAAFQYSKAFILLQEIEYTTPISRLISYFLKRDYIKLRELVNEITFSDDYKEETFQEVSNEEEVHIKIHTIILARVFNLWLSYLYIGEEEYISQVKNLLDNQLEIAQINNTPDIWWLIRLLRIVFDGFLEANLWSFLPNNISPDGEHNDSLHSFIYSLAFRKPQPIVELFPSQRKTLPKVLDTSRKGCVVSLPTSSGKTRIAEIAILQSLLDAPDSKIFYFAPFRSLAFEIEQSLSKTFSPIGYRVSHIYGGSQYNAADRELIQDAQIIVVTPEKAKAIIRSNSEIMDDVSLVVIDEGHLVGAGQRRLVLNELFLEEIRAYLENRGGQVLVLSAVLPNVEHLASWLTSSNENYEKDDWRPSSERFGTLRWTGERVDIHWVNQSPDTPPFNKNFILKNNGFPSNKKEAIGATAIKLSAFGSVLIFVGLKSSVFTHAKEVLKAMGNEPEDFSWNSTNTWNRFLLACEEAFGQNSDWVKYAKKGILCHNADLPAEVRTPLEKLMRDENPSVIIATSTLGQGVNIGVSTVIFAQVWQGGKLLKYRDFWNIAGRAGRAFTDVEGRVLCVIDETQEDWKVDRDIRNTNKFFKKENVEKTYSGLLAVLKNTLDFALENGVNRELFLELIAEIPPRELTEKEEEVADYVKGAFDLIDDTLVALDLEFEAQDLGNPSDWIEEFFRKSLAAIQESLIGGIDLNDIITFLKKRNDKIIEELGNEPQIWKAFITTGIPYQSSKLVSELEEQLVEISNDYLNSDQNAESLQVFLKSVEIILKDLSIFQNDEDLLSLAENHDLLDKIRIPWLGGHSLASINNLGSNTAEKNKIRKTINSYYSFSLPWAINGVAKYLKSKNLEENALAYEELAVICELGLPSMKAVKIYLSGVKSRTTASDIANHLSEIYFSDLNLLWNTIIRQADTIRPNLSEKSKEWLDLFIQYDQIDKVEKPKIPNFRFIKEKYHNIQDEYEYLVARIFDNKIYLCSLDNKFTLDVSGGRIDFSSVVDDMGVRFFFNYDRKSWEMELSNPNYFG